MGAICDGCGKAAMYTVKIGEMSVCEECVDKAKNQLKFETWMGRVDQCIGDIVGVSVRDLPVFDYRDRFDSGERPEDVAHASIQEAVWGT